MLKPGYIVEYKSTPVSNGKSKQDVGVVSLVKS